MPTGFYTTGFAGHDDSGDYATQQLEQQLDQAAHDSATDANAFLQSAQSQNYHQPQAHYTWN